MFDPAKAADEIKKEYIGYIATTFHFRDGDLRRHLTDRLNCIVAKGPIVEIKDAFKSGATMQDLIDEGVLSPLFTELEKGKSVAPKLPLTRPLYAHQENAIRKIVAGKNVVVSTGTGSGKTNCFLIPILNELLREKEQGALSDGVRAIFIYPMNALANDQIKGLREILMEYPDIKFGVYNGGTEHREADAIKLYEAMYENEQHPKLRHRLENELLSRDEMKKTPPHILFTNYAMLEHLLLRPGDDVLFSQSPFKFVVLDEAHVYAGATGIETAFLMGRLKGRICGDRPPQFILTSATLGTGSGESGADAAAFAENLTGCAFESCDVVAGERDPLPQTGEVTDYPISLFEDLADEEAFVKDVLVKYNISTASADDAETLYDIISTSKFYREMRRIGKLVDLDGFARRLGIAREQAVAFIALCAKARKNGKPLADIRYHYFLRALDGCYLALDHKKSLSLVRSDMYEYASGNFARMFEIAVCKDCGEIALVGKIKDGSFVMCSQPEEAATWQIGSFESEDEGGARHNCTDRDEYADESFVLCKNCGRVIPADEHFQGWCECEHAAEVRLNKVMSCINCGGELRKFRLGYEAATGVVATSLYEQIPEHTYVDAAGGDEKRHNIFGSARQKKTKTSTGSQFLIFSDSRQGAAKFACNLEDYYKEFLRRRAMWSIADMNECKGVTGMSVIDLVKTLENLFSAKRLFRENNSDNAESSAVENTRNAWIAVLNEMCRANSDTSLVALGKLSFEYKGNVSAVEAVVQKYNVNAEDAKNFLDYLAFSIVQDGAIETSHATDINDNDRRYLFYTPVQPMIVGQKGNGQNYVKTFLPVEQRRKDGTVYYSSSNSKLRVTKQFLKLGDEAAVAFLKEYWDFLTGEVENAYKLRNIDGKGYRMPANYFSVKFGEAAKVWKCEKCGKTTQFNIQGICRHQGCGGRLRRLAPDETEENNHYVRLYSSDKMRPLFVKEHTAQLDKKEALDYQQQFIRKEINALSCSTTFEMGVDVGDLETVFLRNIPPLAANYAQRVGRAGRSIDAAAFALTYARLGSHDFTFFDSPAEMINGVIYPPKFKLENEKILRRHVYAIAISMYLRNNSALYNGNNADKFLNEKGYNGLFVWLNTKPQELAQMLQRSIPRSIGKTLAQKYVDSFEWIDEFIGDDGCLSKLIYAYEQNVSYLTNEIQKAAKVDVQTAASLQRALKRYRHNDLIDFLVRGNILPKYGFPVDAVELSQNLSDTPKTLNLNRDLSVAIAEYAPSAEVIADGRLYTSRYIRKPIVNKKEMDVFEIAYMAECPDCGCVNFSNIPIGEGRVCAVCGRRLSKRDFNQSIEPRAGFIAEQEVRPVPLSSQERKYKTEDIYIGDKEALRICEYEYDCNGIGVKIESTSNDSLVVRSTEKFYVCSKCGYAIAGDEEAKLGAEYNDYYAGAGEIKDAKHGHPKPFGGGECENKNLKCYRLHHEFRTDVAKLSFECDTSDKNTMLSVMYAILNAFAGAFSIERRDIKACLTYKQNGKNKEHQIIIYDAVPGGAGHSRRLATQDGAVFKKVIEDAVRNLSSCTCSPSCYRCLRSYENQKIHELLDRKKALDFLKRLCE